MRYGLAIAVWLLVGCPGGYGGNFMNVTNNRVDRRDVRKTPGGVRFVAPTNVVTPEFTSSLDQRTNDLERCLGKRIRRDWFVVLVPPDWYGSACSDEQLVPSTMPCQLCRNKGLVIPDECCGVAKPTARCRCVCNARAVIQDNYYIVTAPNLKLYKAELARLVTGVNNVWVDTSLVKCVGN